MRIRRIAAAIAASAACFATLASAPSASAVNLDVYDSGGTGDGVVATFAIRPSIFDPLAQAGALHTETTFSSQGGGVANALSAPVFPGTFAIGAIKGAVGCAGLPGGWLFGTYPTVPSCPRSQEFKGFDSDDALNITALPVQAQAALKVVRDSSDVDLIHARATADFGYVESFVKTGQYTIAQDAKTPPFVLVRDVHVTNYGQRTDTVVTQTIQVETQGVELLGGLVKIGSIVSTATTSSDGNEGSATGSLVFKNVTVKMGEETYQARIDNRGIAIHDQKVPATVGLNETLQEALLQGGISIRSSSPVKTVDGPSAEMSVGGLQMLFTGSAPPVPVPSQIAPVFSQIFDAIPTKCVYELVPKQVDDIAHVPLCFGAGVVPGSRSAPTFSLSIASVNAFSVASSTINEFGGGSTTGGGGSSFGDGGFSGGSFGGGNFGGGGTSVLGDQFTHDAGGSNSTGGGNTSGGGQNVTNPVVPLGIVARMPSAVPLAGALAFLILAVGMALGPSLRHARAR